MTDRKLSRWFTRASGALVVVVLMAGVLGACSSPSKPEVTNQSAGVAWKRCDNGSAGVPASPAVRAFEPGSAVESVLSEQLGVGRGAVGLAAGLPEAVGDAPTALSHTRALQGRLLDAPGWFHAGVSDVARPVLNSCARQQGEILATVVSEMDSRNRIAADGTVPDRQPVPDLAADAPATEPLVTAFRRVFAVRTPWARRPEAKSFAANERAIRALAAALSPEAQRALATVVDGMAQAEDWRLQALKLAYPQGIDHAALGEIFGSMAVPLPVIRRFDYPLMGMAGAALALAVERLKNQLASNPLPAGLDFEMATPVGDIVLRGTAAADTHTYAAPALIVDAGGNDTYQGTVAGPAMESIPLSVVIDLAGDDRYEAGDASRTQGSGVLSFGFLLDRAGNDTYRAADFAQGQGMFGVGAILDEAGDDTYDARSRAQGAGAIGIGMAVDLGGRDSWRITSRGQGFGSARSAGVLIDAGGDDVYDAQDTEIINPSAQTREHNTSLAQGMGFGQRGDQPGASANGGTGMLVDLAGNDRYSCGVFCQGAGYYFGQGVLYDRSGDDGYRGVWYTQGSAAHFAKGALIDDAGRDSYTTVIKGSRGEGHDQSAGFFLEGGGDDTYAVAPLSNGVSNNAGFGFFVDVAGADSYATIETAEPGRFGQAVIDGDFVNYLGYEGALALGVFLDLGGEDRYAGAPPGVGNALTWKLGAPPGAPAPPAEHAGVGRDVG